MDFETQRRKRMEALEDKKKRLEEMKKSRNTRLVMEHTEDGATLSVDNRVDVDNLVNSLLEGSDAVLPKLEQDNTIESKSIDPTAQKNDILAEKQKSLSTVKLMFNIQILPTITETYDKMSQTDEIEAFSQPEIQGVESPDGNIMKAIFRRAHLSAGRQHGPSTPSFSLDNSTLSSPMHPRSSKKLSSEDQKEIIGSDSFKKFLSSSSRILERALGQSRTFDIFVDYCSDRDAGRQLSENHIFTMLGTFDDDYSRNRPVMDMQTSPHRAELFLAAYGAKGQAFQNKGAWQLVTGSEDDPAGLVCIWSQLLQNRPEFKFTSSSPVLTARFHPVEQHLVVGGCYSGQVLLWDMRAKALPVQRSNLAGRGHKHPVYSLGVLGVNTSPELVSVSTDGTLCHWDTSRLTDPTSVSQIQVDGAGGGGLGSGSTSEPSRNVYVSTMCLGQGEASRDAVFGSESGKLYRAGLPLRPTDPIKQVL